MDAVSRGKSVAPCEDEPKPLWADGVRRRLLNRVADADDSHLTLGAEEGRWQPFARGVQIKVLREHEGVMSYLLRLAPGL